jgi:hypothetical protein
MQTLAEVASLEIIGAEPVIEYHHFFYAGRERRKPNGIVAAGNALRIGPGAATRDWIRACPG